MALSISNEVVKTVINKPAYDLAYSHKISRSMVDIDLFTEGHPFHLYDECRNNAPVLFHQSAEYDVDPGFWSLTQYEDIQYVSMNPKIFSSQLCTGTLMTLGEEARRHPKLWRSSIDHMLNLDGDLHINLRREHMPFFKPGYVDELHKKVKTKVTQLLDVIAPMGSCNLVHHFSQQLPIFTLSEILGIPESDRQKLVSWMEFLELAQHFQVESYRKELAGETAATPDENTIAMFNAMVDEMFEYGRDILIKKRQNPENDLLSAIANAELEGEKLSDEFLDGSWLLIIFAGNDTTRNTLSGAIKLLTEFPDQKELLLANMELLPNFVQESIRMISPVIHMRRTTTQEATIGKQKIGPGEKIIMWYGAANRDPAIFDRPNDFNIQRPNADKHLAFGIGRHTCLGKPIALMQLQEAYSQILQRFPDMRYDGEWKVAPNNFVHAIQEMPVSFTAE
ncbi:MAG: cytochrome P450 [Gammaproteobacteria bacterium]|jgi:cytochrome P450